MKLPVKRVIGKLRKVAVILDPDMATLLAKEHLCIFSKRYACFYSEHEGRRKCIPVHRFVLGLAHAPRSVKVDHKNGNGFDNRRINLRKSTHAENLRNAGRSKRNKSGYRGVFEDKRGYGFFATISKDRRQHFLGTYPDAETAARAWDQAALKLHGEFARLHFPEDKETTMTTDFSKLRAKNTGGRNR